MCVVVSALKNAEVPGTFADTMQHLLKANNLPHFSLGDITPPTMQGSHQLAEGNVTPPTNKEVERHPTPTCFKATVYKKKHTTTISPRNIEMNCRTGQVILECAEASEAECIQHLSSASAEEFNRLVSVIELKDRAFDQRVGSVKTAAKRPLRSNAGDHGT